MQITELSMDGVAVLLAEGDLDVATAPGLRMRLSSRRGQRIVIDLSRLSFCDTGGLRTIVDEAREARVAGGLVVAVAAPGSPAREVLDIIGATGVLEIHDERSRAIARVRTRGESLTPRA
jgi:anti-anti-sigma factor